MQAGRDVPLRLDEVEALLTSGALVVDACRRGLCAGDIWQPLAPRPVVFALVCALAEAWPGDVDRNDLIADAFRTRRPDESHRVRLRVEIGRLRALVAPLARIEASTGGFALTTLDQRTVVVLAPPIDGDDASFRIFILTFKSTPKFFALNRPSFKAFSDSPSRFTGQ